MKIHGEISCSYLSYWTGLLFSECPTPSFSRNPSALTNSKQAFKSTQRRLYAGDTRHEIWTCSSRPLKNLFSERLRNETRFCNCTEFNFKIISTFCDCSSGLEPLKESVSQTHLPWILQTLFVINHKSHLSKESALHLLEHNKEKIKIKGGVHCQGYLNRSRGCVAP